MTSLLEFKDLSVNFRSREGNDIEAVKHVSFSLEKGKVTALVGESGSGKSVTALAAMRLLPSLRAYHPSGVINFKGENLLLLPESKMREIRGRGIGMIFQEPMTALNPLHTIGKQIAEPLLIHGIQDKKHVLARVYELLELVGLNDFKDRLSAYPHELSGGQRQRVTIAMALANNPEVLIADEPTTALDVTIQRQILELLLELKNKLGMAVLLITHDLHVVRSMADHVCVMCKGELVEQGDTESVFRNPQHSYTQHLLASEPKGFAVKADVKAEPILETSALTVRFPIKKGVWKSVVGYVDALANVDFTLKAGHTLGVVGESGSGKTTLANAILRVVKSEGIIRFDGNPIEHVKGEPLRLLRRDMQMVFQDPFSSLNPRMTVRQIIEEGLKAHGVGETPAIREEMIAQVLTRVGLDPAMHSRYPHEFSGGQRQRIAIARALILKPRFMVLDEPTSALDMSVQAQIVDLLRQLQEEEKLSYLFISHDLRVIRAISHDILVLKNGKMVEYGATEAILTNPKDPYTQCLIAAAFGDKKLVA
ncbi:MAG: gsiA 9 [Rickettsiales bacterium]|jgi:microcin C transport system ATP-binding protein|nr:gsiA 9 [Rickettsiales bacterium]